ncbi:MAG: PspC domain-containing protein [Saprospiraceae bacterium]|nr:PspC domain-containing protein [Saprospiraceae bacterium]
MDEAATSQNTEGAKKTTASSNSSFQTGKRLFRDEENKMVGGVCAGLAAYFGIDVIWLRIIWGLLFFFGGSGLLLYIILWAVVPSAKTTADRLAMRGQPIDVNNIAKTVETSFEKFSEKVNEFGKPENQERFQQQVQQFSTGVGNFLQSLFKGLGGVGRVFAIIIAVGLVIFLFISWIGATIAASFASPLLGYVTDETWKGTMAGFNGFGIFASVSALLILAIRRLIYKRQANGGIITGLWVFLAINAFSLISIGGSLAKNFTYDHQVSQTIDLSSIDTLNIAVALTSNNSGTQFGSLRVSDEFLLAYEVDMRVERSDNGKFELVKNFQSHGGSSEEAQRLAKSISYDPSVSNNTLTLGEYFKIPNGTKWRDQDVDLILKVPDGKVIKYNRNATGMIRWVERDEDDDNDDNCFDSNVRVWKMTENGFVCLLTEADGDKDNNKRKRKR